jgi:hypothetical protein
VTLENGLGAIETAISYKNEQFVIAHRRRDGRWHASRRRNYLSRRRRRRRRHSIACIQIRESISALCVTAMVARLRHATAHCGLATTRVDSLTSLASMSMHLITKVSLPLTTHIACAKGHVNALASFFVALLVKAIVLQLQSVSFHFHFSYFHFKFKFSFQCSHLDDRLENGYEKKKRFCCSHLTPKRKGRKSESTHYFCVSVFCVLFFVVFARCPHFDVRFSIARARAAQRDFFFFFFFFFFFSCLLHDASRGGRLLSANK